MNIKNRLKKIEGEMNLDSNFCRCQRDVIFKVEPREETIELPPETCETCNKEIDRKFITFNFNSPFETELLLPPYRVIEPGDELQG